MKKFNIPRLEQRIQVHGSQIAAFHGKIKPFVKHISDATAHAGSKVSSARAQHHDQSVGHILATVIANAFHYGCRSRISNSETFAGHAVKKRFTACRSIESN